MALKVFVALFLLTTAVSAKQFRLDRDGQACALVDVNAVFNVQVEQNNTRETAAEFNLDQLNTTVNGTCPDGNASSYTMFVDIENFATWRLIFLLSETRVQLHQLFLFVPRDALNNTEFTNETVVEDAPVSLDLSSPETSFECDSPQNFSYVTTNTTDPNFTYIVTQVLSMLRIQAFNLENSTFSQAERCAQDGFSTEAPPANETTTISNETTTVSNETTTVEPTTPTTLAPVPPAPPAEPNTYVVNGTNATCIVLRGIITFNNITYEKRNGNETTLGTVSVPIPLMNTTANNIVVEGNCFYGNNEQLLNITFNENMNLLMVFSRLSDGTNNDYSVKQIQLTVRSLDSVYFPDAANQTASITAANMNITSDFMKGQASGSYKCDAKVTETLSGGVIFETTNLQYKAFNSDNSTDFTSDNIYECSADEKSNSIVPIVVGASLAGLVVIVLIAYLIGRRRSRRTGYESV